MCEPSSLYQTMEDVDLAIELGCIYRGDASRLTPPVPEDVSCILSRLDESFASLKGMHDFVMHTPRLRTSPVLGAFVAQHPLDRILHLIRAEHLLSEHWVHDMLVVLEETFRSHTHSQRFCERLAAGLPVAEVVQRASVDDYPCFTNCLNRLVFMCATCRDFVRDSIIFRHLATHVSREEHLERIMYLIEVGELHEDTHLIESVYVSLLHLLYSHRTSDSIVHAVERLLRHNVDLRSERCYLSHTFQLWRTGWPVAIGPVVAHLLDTCNVSLVVEWDRMGKLAGLVRASVTHKTIEWCAVRGLLRHLVPLRVREVLCESIESRTTPVNVTCPITLDYVVNPVVVSDGHTYERDAIMRHFVNSGFVSPLTRQRVAPYVFINRAGVFAD